LTVIGCGDGEQATGGSSGNGGSSGTAGSGGSVDPNLCLLGLCMDDETLSTSCLDEYNACVGRGHYDWACALDADEACGI